MQPNIDIEICRTHRRIRSNARGVNTAYVSNVVILYSLLSAAYTLEWEWHQAKIERSEFYMYSKILSW